MASHESALKAHRQSLKNRERNRQFRSRLRSALKTIRTAIDGNDLAGAKSGLKQTISLIDKMASKGIIHRNAAGRYKSRLSTPLARKASKLGSGRVRRNLPAARRHPLPRTQFDDQAFEQDARVPG